MTLRRVAICMALAACIALMSPVWGNNYQSNLVPGDLRPVGEALGVDEANDYYTLAELFEALVSRIELLETLASSHGASFASLQSNQDEITQRVNILEEACPLPESLYVSIVHAPAEVNRGNPACITIQTLPYAKCSITVTLPSGKTSEASGLQEKQADERGIINWVWLVRGNTSPGTATARIVSSTARETHVLLFEFEIIQAQE
jgi:hypothetical protein